MANCYRVKPNAYAQLYGESEFKLFTQNIQVHLRNIANRAKGASLTKLAKRTFVGMQSTFAEGCAYAKIPVKQFIKDFPLSQILFGSWWVPKVTSFAKTVVLGTGEVVKSYSNKYKITHLKARGKTPVIVSFDYELFTKKNGNLQGVSPDFIKILNSNNKSGGVMLLNSGNSYQACQKALSHFKGKNVCVSAYNGAFITINDGKNGRKIIKDERLPNDAVRALYDYFKKNENKALLKNYYMVIEGKGDKVGVVDFSRGKVRGFKGGRFTDNEMEVESALNRAYQIRFVPKKDKAGLNNAVANVKTYSEHLNKQAEFYNEKAGNVASILASVDEPLWSMLNEGMNVQFESNGQISLVPKGCSKLNSARLIAHSYGLSEEQVLTMAASTSDVCEPATFANIAKFLKNGGNVKDLAMNVQEVSRDLVNDINHLCIPANFARTPDFKKLCAKFDKDVTAENKRILDEANARELSSFEQEQKQELEEILKKYSQELEDIEKSDISESELLEEQNKIRQMAQFAISSFETNLINKENELKARKIQPVLDRISYQSNSYADVSRKIEQLSQNEIEPDLIFPEQTLTLCDDDMECPTITY
ncbi:MAG: HAD hydrolase family protein [Clostridia bacterium]|nr:HAD hydrolase family protein [Clostridia bacterium]